MQTITGKIKLVFAHLAATYNLFLSVFVRTEQVDSLHMAKVDVMTQQKDEYQLANVFLLLVAI